MKNEHGKKAKRNASSRMFLRRFLDNVEGDIRQVTYLVVSEKNF